MDAGASLSTSDGRLRSFSTLDDLEKGFDLCLRAVSLDGDNLAFVPRHLRTAEICWEAARHDISSQTVRQFWPREFLAGGKWILDLETLRIIERDIKAREAGYAESVRRGKSLETVPADRRSHDVCLAAISRRGTELLYVPDSLRSPAFCELAVRQNAKALLFVPEKLKTKKLCLAAVRQDGRMLGAVPEMLRDAEICAAAMEGGMSDEVWKKDFPEHFKGPSFRPCLSLAELREIEELRSIYIDMLVGQIAAGRSLRTVPESMKVPFLCRSAITANGGMELEFVPFRFKDREICEAAVRNNGSALRFVPETVVDSAICEAALASTPEAFQWVPQSLMTYGMSLPVIVRYPSFFKYLPGDLIRTDLADIAVKKCGENLRLLPDGIKKPELCLAAVKQDGALLEYVPNCRKSARICTEALKQSARDPGARRKVEAMLPEYFKDASGKALNFREINAMEKRRIRLENYTSNLMLKNALVIRGWIEDRMSNTGQPGRYMLRFRQSDSKVIRDFVPAGSAGYGLAMAEEDTLDSFTRCLRGSDTEKIPTESGIRQNVKRHLQAFVEKFALMAEV